MGGGWSFSIYNFDTGSQSYWIVTLSLLAAAFVVFCIIFANGLDPDPNRLTSLRVFLKEFFFEKVLVWFFTSQSTAMFMSERSVHQTTLFEKVNRYLV